MRLYLFILVRKQTFLLPQREELSLLSKAVCYTNILKKIVLNKSCHCLYSKVCKNASDSWRILSQQYSVVKSILNIHCGTLIFQNCSLGIYSSWCFYLSKSPSLPPFLPPSILLFLLFFNSTSSPLPFLSLSPSVSVSVSLFLSFSPTPSCFLAC